MDIFLPPSSRRDAILSALHNVPWPSDDADRPAALLAKCPAAMQTPLITSVELAQITDVDLVSVKDERGRMGMGSFKALGAAYVIARDAETGTAQGRTYVAASAGNHGLSIAAGAAAFGAKAVIYLAAPVPEAFAARLTALGARVIRHGQTYEQSMQGAQAAATDNGWALLPDSSWPGYMDRPRVLMEGYLVLMRETATQMDLSPTHIFLQAGVGGLAAACAVYARKQWGRAPKIIIVEPKAAPALCLSMQAGTPQITTGPISDMGRLDCKEPSLIALKSLARDADVFATITEDEGRAGAVASAKAGFASTPSGAAGIAGLIASGTQRKDLGLNQKSRILIILSEEANG